MRDYFADDEGAGTASFEQVRGALSASAESFDRHVLFLTAGLKSLPVRSAVKGSVGAQPVRHHLVLCSRALSWLLWRVFVLPLKGSLAVLLSENFP